MKIGVFHNLEPPRSGHGFTMGTPTARHILDGGAQHQSRLLVDRPRVPVVSNAEVPEVKSVTRMWFLGYAYPSRHLAVLVSEHKSKKRSST